MKHNKLVRDKIPASIRDSGREPVTHVASDNEYREKVYEKLQEEIREFTDAKNEEELADVFEVIDAICLIEKFDISKVKDIQRKKAEECGKFINKIILDDVI